MGLVVENVEISWKLIGSVIGVVIFLIVFLFKCCGRKIEKAQNKDDIEQQVQNPAQSGQNTSPFPSTVHPPDIQRP